MNFSDACRRYSKNHRYVPFVRACVENGLVPTRECNGKSETTYVRDNEATSVRRYSGRVSPALGLKSIVINTDE